MFLVVKRKVTLSIAPINDPVNDYSQIDNLYLANVTMDHEVDGHKQTGGGSTLYLSTTKQMSQ